MDTNRHEERAFDICHSPNIRVIRLPGRCLREGGGPLFPSYSCSFVLFFFPKKVKIIIDFICEDCDKRPHSQTKTLGTNQTTTETPNPRTLVRRSLVRRRNPKTKPSETKPSEQLQLKNQL